MQGRPLEGVKDIKTRTGQNSEKLLNTPGIFYTPCGGVTALPTAHRRRQIESLERVNREALSWGEAGTRDREYGKEEDNVQVSSRSLKPLAASS